MNVSCALEKNIVWECLVNIYWTLLSDEIFHKYNVDDFHLPVLSMIEREVLESPTISSLKLYSRNFEYLC